MSIADLERPDVRVNSMPRQKSRIKFLEFDEVHRVIEHTRDMRERALVETLFSTGLRVSECVNLPRHVVDMEDPLNTQEVSIIGKGGYQRVVFFSPQSIGAVTSYLRPRQDHDSRMFPMTKRTAERIVARAARAAGLKATPHTLRHSLATHLLRQGANIRIVQEMLGHRAISSTQVYTGCTNRDLLEAHKKFV